ncbi:hypothetical protein [uncultured Mediterranean phage]|nr:hypothetical protein [uncultured Mediterranean phage]
MRFLKKHQAVELDEAGQKALAQEMYDFHRSGRYTLDEWESLSDEEKTMAVQVAELSRVEEASMLASAIRGEESFQQMVNQLDDGERAANSALDHAVARAGRNMNSPKFAYSHKKVKH